LVWFVLSLAGCLQVDTLIKVKPDGSGTIEETFMMRKDIVEMRAARLRFWYGCRKKNRIKRLPKKPRPVRHLKCRLKTNKHREILTDDIDRDDFLSRSSLLQIKFLDM